MARSAHTAAPKEIRMALVPMSVRFKMDLLAVCFAA
jgi:hypothetical protein